MSRTRIDVWMRRVAALTSGIVLLQVSSCTIDTETLFTDVMTYTVEWLLSSMTV